MSWSASPLPLPFPPPEAWLFGSSQADPASRASPRRCVHFAKQQKFIAQVIDLGAAASPRISLALLIPFSRLSFPCFLAHHLWCQRKASQEGAVLVPALPVTSHMNLSFSIRKTEMLRIPAPECVGLPGARAPGAPAQCDFTLPGRGVALGPAFQRGTLRPRDLRSSAQAHRAGKQQP